MMASVISAQGTVYDLIDIEHAYAPPFSSAKDPVTVAGYVVSEGDAVIAQPESAITMIRLMYSLVPMVLMALLAVSAFAISKLSKRMPEIEAKIAEEAAE